MDRRQLVKPMARHIDGQASVVMGYDIVVTKSPRWKDLPQLLRDLYIDEVKRELGTGYAAVRDQFEDPEARVFEHVMEPLIARRMAEINLKSETQDPYLNRLLVGEHNKVPVLIVGGGPEAYQQKVYESLTTMGVRPHIILANERYPIRSTDLRNSTFENPAIVRPSLTYEPSPAAKGDRLLINAEEIQFAGFLGTHKEDIAAAIHSAWEYHDFVILRVSLKQLYSSDEDTIETLRDWVDRQLALDAESGLDPISTLRDYLDVIASELVQKVQVSKVANHPELDFGGRAPLFQSSDGKRLRLLFSFTPAVGDD